MEWIGPVTLKPLIKRKKKLFDSEYTSINEGFVFAMYWIENKKVTASFYVFWSDDQYI